MARGFTLEEARQLPEDEADKYLDAWNELRGAKDTAGKLVKSKKKK